LFKVHDKGLYLIWCAGIKCLIYFKTKSQFIPTPFNSAMHFILKSTTPITGFRGSAKVS
jgi:hypothetical protein